MTKVKKAQTGAKVPDLKGPWIDKQKAVLNQGNKLCKGGKVKKR